MTQTLKPIDVIMRRLEAQLLMSPDLNSAKVQIYLSPESGELLTSRDVNVIAQLIRALGVSLPLFYVLQGSNVLVKELTTLCDTQALCKVVSSFEDTGTIVIITLKRECPPFESQRAPFVTAFLVKGTVRVSIYTD